MKAKQMYLMGLHFMRTEFRVFWSISRKIFPAKVIGKLTIREI